MRAVITSHPSDYDVMRVTDALVPKLAAEVVETVGEAVRGLKSPEDPRKPTLVNPDDLDRLLPDTILWLRDESAACYSSTRVSGDRKRSDRGNA